MKKLFLLVAALLMIGIAPVSAQSAAKAPVTHTKADGTPDKRYKENKTDATAKKPAGPVKKDGTADMRYKANKESGAAKVR